MLNKKMQQQAENIAEAMRPIFARAYELGKKYDKTRNQQHKAERIAHSWQYKDSRRDWEYITEGTHTQEERDDIRAIYENNPRHWHEVLETKYKEQHAAETAHQCARINFINYLNYAARFLGDMIRPIWRELVNRRGLETLAEIINQKNPRKDHSAGACSCALYLRSAELNDNNPAEVGQYARIEAAIYTGWACGICGECARYYQINPAEVWHFAELPHLLTVRQYEKNKAKAAQKVAEIENQAEELQRFAAGCGLLGFVDIVKIEKTK